MKKFKAFLYSFLFLTGLVAAVWYSGKLSHPRTNLTQLVEQVNTNKNKPYYLSSTGFLRMSSQFYVAALYTEKDSNFSPVKYLLITRTHEGIHVDLISGAGVENSKSLSGEDAIKYLESKNIAYKELDALWQQQQ